MDSRLSWNRVAPLRVPAIVLIAVSTTACINGPAVMTQQVEARQLAAHLHIGFTQANEAANRAVMADTDEASVAAAKEAEQATASVDTDIQRLRPILESLAYKDEIASFERFALKFGEYRKLDAEILPLAVENTNLKAQRLSFGAGQEAANAVFTALTAAQEVAPKSAEAVSDAASCRVAVLSVQVIQARHIAESDDAAMTRMEREMSDSEQSARAALARLRQVVPAAGAHVTEAALALDRFIDVNRQIIDLSRRNSNVRSLALTLGRKRVVAAECDEQLRQLDDALSAHAFAATR